MRTRLVLHAFIATALCTALTCKSERIGLGDHNGPVKAVGITLGFPGYVSDASLTLGDKDTVRATASTGGWPAFTKYDSSKDPRRFIYLSSNPAVASVDVDGVVEAHSTGTTNLFASVDGVTSPPLALTVSPRAASLVAQPESVLVAAGEKFIISVKALDTTGASVNGVVFNVGVDTTYWAVTSMPDEGSWKLQTPAELHLSGKVAGRVRILVTTQNERPQGRLTASVPVKVRAQ